VTDDVSCCVGQVARADSMCSVLFSHPSSLTRAAISSSETLTVVSTVNFVPSLLTSTLCAIFFLRKELRIVFLETSFSKRVQSRLDDEVEIVGSSNCSWKELLLFCFFCFLD